jgi:hypothetical protein
LLHRYKPSSTPAMSLSAYKALAALLTEQEAEKIIGGLLLKMAEFAGATAVPFVDAAQSFCDQVAATFLGSGLTWEVVPYTKCCETFI